MSLRRSERDYFRFDRFQPGQFITVMSELMFVIAVYFDEVQLGTFSQEAAEEMITDRKILVWSSAMCCPIQLSAHLDGGLHGKDVKIICSHREVHTP